MALPDPPPGYVPDGLPNHPVTITYKEGQAEGSLLRDSFYFYRERVNND